MAKKKPHWRRGVVASRPGEPDKPARENVALRFLRLANAEPDPDKRKQHLLAAQVCEALGTANEAMVDLNTYRPGRPRGPRLENLDAPMQAFMERESARTGEKRKWTLARLAVEHSNVPKDEHENTKNRLVRWWDSRD